MTEHETLDPPAAVATPPSVGPSVRPGRWPLVMLAPWMWFMHRNLPGYTLLVITDREGDMTRIECAPGDWPSPDRCPWPRDRPKVRDMNPHVEGRWMTP